MTADQIKAVGGSSHYLDSLGILADTQVNHLKLNWSDTLQFQAVGQQKFQKALTDEQQIQSDINCTSILSILCTPLGNYLGLKSNETEASGKKRDPTKDKVPQADETILYDTNSDKTTIQIQNYLNWIKSNYGTFLTTTIKAAP
jgi:hypothetical protein